MKGMKLFLLSMSFLFIAGVSCTERIECPERMEGVMVCAGGSSWGVAQTRASLPLSATVAPLPEGTTLWLLIEEPVDPDRHGFDDEWKISPNYAMRKYVVLGKDAALVPCETDEDGRLVGDPSNNRPLMLRDGWYKFHAVSPAKELHDDLENDLSDIALIHNGEYVLATDTRWEETAPLVVEVNTRSDMGSFQMVKLNPLINQTAEMELRLYMGDNVTDVDILPEGVEVAGVQEDRGTGVPFHWSTDNSYLPIRVGNKYNWLKVTTWEWEDDCLVGRLSILPTDATTNAIFIVFNISVNGVPTQYMATLKTQYFESAYRYTYSFQVNVSDGIVVAAWDNISNVKDVRL